MGSQLPDNSLKKLQRNNMIQETKDTVANTVTILGTGSVVMGVSEWLTLVLLITGSDSPLTAIFAFYPDQLFSHAVSIL